MTCKPLVRARLRQAARMPCRCSRVVQPTDGRASGPSPRRQAPPRFASDDRRCPCRVCGQSHQYFATCPAGNMNCYNQLTGQLSLSCPCASGTWLQALNGFVLSVLSHNVHPDRSRGVGLPSMDVPTSTTELENCPAYSPRNLRHVVRLLMLPTEYIARLIISFQYVLSSVL